MVYLHTTEQGGETIFPRANLKITPQKGKAVLFYNVTEEDELDPMSFHGGAPVVQGEKWLITRWLREEEFH
jgi:prolyl 4-hydroxylase